MVRFEPHMTTGQLVTLSKLTRSLALRSDWRLPSPWFTSIWIKTFSTIPMVYYSQQRRRNPLDITYQSEKY